MEQIVKDKIDKAYEALAAKIEAHNNAVDEFEKEFFTPEIEQSLKDYEVNTRHNFSIRHMGEDDDWIEMRKYSTFHKMITNNRSLNLDRLLPKAYDDDCIYDMQRKETLLKGRSENFTFILNHAEDIAREIVEDYKTRNEKRNDELDNLLAQLDVENEPSKHIKITIEWV